MEPNCERHPRYRGEYIAYDASGYAFRIAQRMGHCAGKWEARPSHLQAKSDTRRFMADSLRVVCQKVGASTKAEGRSDDA